MTLVGWSCALCMEMWMRCLARVGVKPGILVSQADSCLYSITPVHLAVGREKGDDLSC